MAKDAKPLTHSDRFERRVKIAAAVKSGATLSATARKFRVTIRTVQTACHENGVRWAQG